MSRWGKRRACGDMAAITVGRGTNVQDNATLHVDTDLPLTVGSGVTVGHNAILHGCTVGNDCLIGMAAVILNGAVIGDQSVVGAGALVTEGKQFPPRSLIVGSPAKVVRQVDDALLEKIRANARTYIGMAQQAAIGLKEPPR